MLEPKEIMHGTEAILRYIGAAMEQCYPSNSHSSGVIVTYPKNYPWPENCSTHSLDTSKFHFKWEWIMPVVIKINKTERFSIKISSLCAWVSDTEVPEFETQNTANTADNYEFLIEAVFSACWEAVELIEAENEPARKTLETC